MFKNPKQGYTRLSIQFPSIMASESTNQTPNPQSPQLISPEMDYFGSTPDPLLYPGAFITENFTGQETLMTDDTFFQNQVEEEQKDQNLSEPEMVQVPETSENVSGGEGVDAGTSNNDEIESPVPLNAAFPVKTPSRRGRRKRSSIVDTAAVTIASVNPDWLPSGWYVEDRLRTSGASAGARDKYYCDPISGKKFRSRQEIIRFQQTGDRHKRGSKVKKDDDVKSGGSSRTRKEKKPKTGASAAKFDHASVPKLISWVVTDSLESSWTPLNGEAKIPQSSKEEWDATFTNLATKNTGGG